MPRGASLTTPSGVGWASAGAPAPGGTSMAGLVRLLAASTAQCMRAWCGARVVLLCKGEEESAGWTVVLWNAHVLCELGHGCVFLHELLLG